LVPTQNLLDPFDILRRQQPIQESGIDPPPFPEADHGDE